MKTLKQNSENFYQDYLQEKLASRYEKNPRYSVRAFARALAVDPGSMSRILSGKQIPSYKMCQMLFSKLEVSPVEQSRFLASVALKQKRFGFKRISLGFKNLEGSSDLAAEHRINLAADQWKIIADWYHGAIMELTNVAEFNSDPRWIARKLGISEAEVKAAITRLVNLKLLEINDGVMRKTWKQVSSGDQTLTSSAHKKLQRQVLQKAETSLEDHPIEVRSMTSMVMAIDPDKIDQAKKMIQQFSRDLCAFLETGNRTQVYQLGVALYPLSSNENNYD